MELFGAKFTNTVETHNDTVRGRRKEAMREWVSRVDDTLYFSFVKGPHPSLL